MYLIFQGLIFFSVIAQWDQLGSNIYGTVGIELGNEICISDDGNTIALAAPMGETNGFGAGEVWVYTFDGEDWDLVGEVITGDFPSDFSGSSVDINADGTIVAIGSRFNSDNGSGSGHVRVFQWLAGIWTQIGQAIVGETESENCGSYLSISDDGLTIAVGSTSSSTMGEGSGRARMFHFDGNAWIQMGQSLNGENPGDIAGNVSLSANGEVVAVGAQGSEVNGLYSGHVKVYGFNGSEWIQLGQALNGEDEQNFVGSAISLSHDGSIIAIGAKSSEISFQQGNVRVFSFDGATWNLMGQVIDGINTGENFGSAVSLSNDGSILLAGASNFNNGIGIARVFQYTNELWDQIGNAVPGPELWDGTYGSELDISGNGSVFISSTHLNDDNGQNAGLVKVYSNELISSISADFFGNSFSLSPNPTYNIANLDLGDEKALSILVCNELGQEVLSLGENLGSQQVISLEGLRSGMYILKITNGENLTVMKLVKE